MIQQPVKILGVAGDKVVKQTLIITEFHLNYWMSVAKKVVNFARCFHPDIFSLFCKNSFTAPKCSFWCLCDVPISLVPGTVPALQWETLIIGWVRGWGVTSSEEINDNLCFGERNSKWMPHAFATSKSSLLQCFCHASKHAHSHGHSCDYPGLNPSVKRKKS